MSMAKLYWTKTKRGQAFSLASYLDFMKMKLNIELKTELSKSATLRFMMKEFVTFHIRRCADETQKWNYNV